MISYIPKSTKSAGTQKLINEALDILKEVGIPFENKTPKALQSMAMVFLAVAGVTKSWKHAKGQNENRHLKTRDIIQFLNHDRLVNLGRSSLKLLLDKGLKALEFQTI